jgi:hypothetical protein
VITDPRHRYTVIASNRDGVQYEQDFRETDVPDAHERAIENLKKIAELFPDCNVFLSSSPEE